MALFLYLAGMTMTTKFLEYEHVTLNVSIRMQKCLEDNQVINQYFLFVEPEFDS